MNAPVSIPASGEALALRRRFMAINARCNELDTFEDRDKAAYFVATERRAALDIVLLTTTPQTLADVAALMVAGFDKTQDLVVFPETPSVAESVAAIVMRVFALSLPIVAAAAGVPLETIVTEADQARHDRCLVPMEALPQ